MFVNGAIPWLQAVQLLGIMSPVAQQGETKGTVVLQPRQFSPDLRDQQITGLLLATGNLSTARTTLSWTAVVR